VQKFTDAVIENYRHKNATVAISSDECYTARRRIRSHLETGDPHTLLARFLYKIYFYNAQDLPQIDPALWSSGMIPALGILHSNCRRPRVRIAVEPLI